MINDHEKDYLAMIKSRIKVSSVGYFFFNMYFFCENVTHMCLIISGNDNYLSIYKLTITYKLKNNSHFLKLLNT